MMSKMSALSVYWWILLLSFSISDAFHLPPSPLDRLTRQYQPRPHTSTIQRHAKRNQPFQTQSMGYNAYLQKKKKQRQRETLLGRILWKWQQFRQFFRSLIWKATVYVLECEHKKYYVGSTKDLNRRMQQHFENPRGGSRWTKVHRPVAIETIVRRVPERYLMGVEAQVTAEYMLKYGVNNVRGAYMSNVRNYTLDDVDIMTAFLGHYGNLEFKSLEKKLRQTLPPPSSADIRRSHRNRKLKQPLVSNYDRFGRRRRRSDQGPQGRISQYMKRNDVCFKCGQKGHWANECPSDNRSGRRAPRKRRNDWNSVTGEIGDELFLRSIVNGSDKVEEARSSDEIDDTT